MAQIRFIRRIWFTVKCKFLSYFREYRLIFDMRFYESYKKISMSFSMRVRMGGSVG